MDEVAKGVFVETGRVGCSVAFVETREGVVLIDTPERPTDAVAWRREAESRGKLLYLINTEHHIDHILGNFFFPCTVIAHEGTRANFHNPSIQFGETVDNPRALVESIDPEGLPLLEGYRAREPSITFSDRLVLRPGGRTFQVFHAPGHLPNSTMVFLREEGVLFASDDVFHDFLPWLHQSDPFAWLKSLRRIRDLAPKVIVPGHGAVCGLGPVDQLETYLRDVVALVRRAVEEGMGRDEAVARLRLPQVYPVPEHFRSMVAQVERMGIGRVFDALTAS